MDYLLHVLILIGIYIILAVSLDLMAGYAGMLSLAQAAFFGIGAYSFALMSNRVAGGFLVVIGCAAAFSGMVGACVGYPSLRIRTEYFAITTLGVQVVLSSLFNNCVSLTGGPMGMTNIPAPIIGRWVASSKLSYLILTAVAVGLVIAVSRLLVCRYTGRVLRAIREDEVFTESLGINVAGYKITISAISASMAAVAGCIYAAYFSFIDPSSFSLTESVAIVSAVILGGAGSVFGPALGAALLISIPEALRFVGLTTATVANLRQILYGSVLVILMLVRPRGLVGQFDFGRKAR